MNEISSKSRLSPGKVSLVGAGPGGTDLITVRGLKRLQQADVVVYDALTYEDLLDEARCDAERIYVGKRGYCVGSMRQDVINQLLADRASQGLNVVRLKGGDPCVFGRGGEEAEHLAELGIPFEIVPGVTTAVGACASALIPLTHRKAGQSIALVTGHLDPDSAESDLNWSALATMSNLVIYMGLRHIEKIAARLIQAGMPHNIPAAVIERATLPDQRVIDGELATIAHLTRTAQVQAPALIVIGEAVRYREKLQSFADQTAEYAR